MKKSRLSLGQKTTILILVFAFILGTASVIFSYVIYSNSTDRHYKTIGSNLVNAVSNVIDADAVEKYATTVTADDKYYAMLEQLRGFQVDPDIMYIFIFRPTPDGQVYIFDTDTSETRFDLGYFYRWYQDFKPYSAMFMRGEDVGPLISNEEFGWIMTVYKQIYNSDGDLIAYVGADLSIDKMINEKAGFLILLIIMMSGIALLFALLYSVYVQKRVVRPIKELAAAADAYLVNGDVSKSNFSALSIKAGPELTSLAQSLSSMEGKIDEYITNLELATEKAETDSMTGLYNKEAFQKRVNAILNNMSDKSNLHAFLMIDLDNYKNINDTYGHVMGDRVLIDCADAMRSMVRAGDLICRMGGDEFAILLYSAGNRDQVELKAGELISSVSSVSLGNGAQISISIGIALYPEDGITMRELYDHADSALYAVKTSGKGSYMFYDKL